MIVFNVLDMTCGHCVGVITKAVRVVDPQASVNVDLSMHRVEIRDSAASPQAFAQAIRDEGYTPLQHTAS
jgi:copper chaperone